MNKTQFKKYTQKCSTIDCESYYYARGLCRKHYRQLLGKEGGYIKSYEKLKNNPEYKEKKSLSDKKYREKLRNSGKLSKKQHEYYMRNISDPERLKKRRERDKIYREKTKESRKEIMAAFQRRYRDELKEKVLRHYSSNELKCAECGIDVYPLLSIDHINNDGAEHKRSLSHGGRASSSRVYADLVKRGFPEGYQVLCFNCNYMKEFIRRCGE